MFYIRNLIYISIFLYTSISNAQVSAPAALQPAGLTPGDTFFVIFTTSTTLDACADDLTATAGEIAATTPTSINTHGTNAAAAGTITSGVAGWNSLYIHNDGVTTTDTVAAAGVAFNNVTDRPIYNTLGQLVANDRDDLFDGAGAPAFPGSTALNNLINFDEDGNAFAGGDFTYTGFGPLGNDTDQNGVGANVPPLGARNNLTGCMVGDPDQSDANWAGAGPSAASRSVFVLSPLLQIPAAVSASTSLTEW
ncbi:hypothetical protein Patl_3768 [Paraglaciecola sp. T6c]|uniref:hypothetical protein n=1 Tax=Pseudoalteromonas atlantica (strain T6c / ATCC BAA-1087) TaxID=3042615 RepID=UPI00005C5A07|nr:hypothetical protein [Paraglaciecola sp. T6c]ABG42268.1 hypothetical protein Patl_3768 [Paraglaciecola sp. T6c]